MCNVQSPHTIDLYTIVVRAIVIVVLGVAVQTEKCTVDHHTATDSLQRLLIRFSLKTCDN